MTIHETQTMLSPSEVIDRARVFFVLAGSPYAANIAEVGDGYMRLQMEVGEIVIGTMRQGEATRVRASASRGAHLITQFFATLAPPLEAHRTVHRFGRHERQGALTEGSRSTAIAEAIQAA